MLDRSRKPRSRKAINQAAYRKRDGAGLIAPNIVFNEHRVAVAMIKSRELTAAQTLDRKRIAAALADYIEEWCKNWE